MFYQSNVLSSLPHEHVAVVEAVVGVQEDLQVHEEVVVSGDGAGEDGGGWVEVVAGVREHLLETEDSHSDLVDGR